MLTAATFTVSTPPAEAAPAPLLDRIHRQVKLTNQLRIAKGYQPIRYHYRPDRRVNVHRRPFYLRQWTARHRQAISLARRYAYPRWWYSQAMCVHGNEGSWTSYNPAGPYFGGMQMDRGFMTSYGRDFMRRHGGRDARYWTPAEQLTAAWRAYVGWDHYRQRYDDRFRRGWNPWPNTAAACGLL